MADLKAVRLTQLPGILFDAGYPAPNYWLVRNAAIERRITAAQDENLRWSVDASDPHAIAQALGLVAISPQIAA